MGKYYKKVFHRQQIYVYEKYQVIRWFYHALDKKILTNQ